ncbi:DUF6232 family protein [Kitasatospora viridis]|uniref:Uncharacterized protein n=1 Tax=Kitasatospora viridis TaxID=281105 RepID=A0A561TT64_9ACTN|nr:DUF6232 family protein [Kitasatospora viridis]TWF90313.1 hypothetical protein FHX73_13357 [Kitasatospora viridis]
MHDAGRDGPAPWTTAPAAPGAPAAPTNAVALTISKRLLFIASAAYPLHNIARVFTFVLRPRRWEAFLRFLKRAGATVVAMVLLLQLEKLQATNGDGSQTTDPWVGLTWVVGLLTLVGYAIALLAVLAAPTHYVLAVETCSSSSALITTPDPEELRRIGGAIAHAIENPEAELHLMVQSLSFKPEHYYFGDTVNMYGGASNVGIKS